MSEPEKLGMPLPAGVCVDCQHGGDVFTHLSGAVLMYCEHNRTGAVLEKIGDGSRVWNMRSPMTREQFLLSIELHNQRFVEANPGASGVLQ